MSMLIVSNVTFDYPGRRVLNGVSFTLPQGSVTALVGPNGAGKTTLLRCLAALHHPMSGEVRLDGLPSTLDPPRYHRKLGFLADDFGLYYELSVERSLFFAARRNGVEPDLVAKRVAEVAGYLGLDAHLKELAGKLSRGWRQRLGIAQAIIHHPPMVLLDEPASGLDPEARIELSRLIRDLRSRGMTLMVSSHILSELSDYSTHVLVLRNGSTDGLKSLGGELERQWLGLELATPWPGLVPWLKARDGVEEVRGDHDQAVFVMSGGPAAWSAVLSALVGQRVMVSSFGPHRESLQRLYMENGRN